MRATLRWVAVVAVLLVSSTRSEPESPASSEGWARGHLRDQVATPTTVKELVRVAQGPMPAELLFLTQAPPSGGTPQPGGSLGTTNPGSCSGESCSAAGVSCCGSGGNCNSAAACSVCCPQEGKAKHAVCVPAQCASGYPSLVQSGASCECK